MQSEAAQLFLDRALLQRPTFQANPSNSLSIASICCRLEGIPLAIELAAARMRSLTVEEIDAHLNQRFQLLVNGNRIASERQRTLSNLIDWSYNLLDDEEKRLFRQLSVFAGGWSCAAAQQVCSNTDVSKSAPVFDVLTRLIDKSLVLPDHQGGKTRYRFLETLRQYSWEKLAEANEVEAALGRHRSYFLTFAKEVSSDLVGSHQSQALFALEAEHDNLLRAIDHAPPEIALEIAGSLWRFWWMHGHSRAGLGLLTELLNRPQNQGPTKVRAEALHGAGWLAYILGELPRSRVFLEKSLELRRSLDDQVGVAASLDGLGSACCVMGDYDLGRCMLMEGIEIGQHLAKPEIVARCSLNLALADYDLGKFKEAEMLLEQCLSIYREQNDKFYIGLTLNFLGFVARCLGDLAQARSLHEEAIVIRQNLGDRHSIAHSQGALAQVALDQGFIQEARHLLARTLSELADLGGKWGIMNSLESYADLALKENQASRAACLLGAASAIRTTTQVIHNPWEKQRFEAFRQTLTVELGTKEFARAWKQGTTMTPDQAVALALS
jgi:tetratricopeptide (TPR) repeat protein